MFELIGVVKRFGPFTALHPMTMRLPQEGVTALIGPSGSGKTSLLKLLAGLMQPDEGEIRFKGEALVPDESYRRRLGYVIQDGGLFPHLTAAANVALVARHLRWSRERRTARIDELAELVQLPRERLARYPSELSGGQRQRVGLMRALMLDPEVLLLDEPFGALDPLIRYDLQQEVQAIIARLNKSAILVTHDLAEARSLGNRIVLLNEGHIVQQGRFEDLVDRPAEPFVSRFVTAQRGLAA
ncbi:MAG: ATP-binding cassette domain-containing protein [Rhodothalassiaceae bacterium]